MTGYKVLSLVSDWIGVTPGSIMCMGIFMSWKLITIIQYFLRRYQFTFQKKKRKKKKKYTKIFVEHECNEGTPHICKIQWLVPHGNVRTWADSKI